MNTFGSNIRISVFGESHGACVGGTIDGIPAGIALDFAMISDNLSRRKPKNADYSTPRRENDDYEILSGVTAGKTNGSPLCVIFRNKDVKSTDYAFSDGFVPRPGHADFPAYIKYDGCCDLRGGGHFSARLTAPIVFFGAIARMILQKEGIVVGSHISSVGEIFDTAFDPVLVNSEQLTALHTDFPVISEAKHDEMNELLSQLRNEKDTIGGTVECAAVNLPIGLGEPFFDSVESSISHLLFSIPSVKGVEFGGGFSLSQMRGSFANDEYSSEYFFPRNNVGKTAHTNNAGGIVGGLTFGMPLIVRVAFKPIPSIGIEQTSIDLQSKKSVQLTVEGRHDVCSALRGAVIVESSVCICLLDFLQNKNKL